MKLLIILLLATLSAYAQEPPSKYDTVKCWTVGIEWNKDSTAHLIMVKSWTVREYRFIGYKYSIDTVQPSIWYNRGIKHYPVWSTLGYHIKYLTKDKIKVFEPVTEFKPIIQDWK